MLTLREVAGTETHRVPGLTSEQVLVEESPIGTDKAGTVGSVSPILTDSVGLETCLLYQVPL